MGSLDALLVLPPLYQHGRTSDHNPKEPMGLMYIAANLRKEGFTTEIIDADVRALTAEQVVDEVIAHPSCIIGFSVMQRALGSVDIIVRTLRDRGVTSHICLGGVTATLSWEHLLRSLPGVDSIVLGEGEESFLALTRTIKESGDWRQISGICYRVGDEITCNSSNRKPDLDSLPWPSRDFLDECRAKSGYATVLGSRGCYGSCVFCSNYSFESACPGPKWRGRNPVDIVDEIESLQAEQGINIFKFNDPNLFGPGLEGKEHVIDLCRELIRRRLGAHLMGFCRPNDIDPETVRLMNRAGFERVLLGIESSSPSVLKKLHKGDTVEIIEQSLSHLGRAGISVVPGFMIFNPYTTFETLRADLVFLEKYGFTPILSKALRVFDGTQIQTILEKEGRLIWKDPLEGYHEYLVDKRVAAVYSALKEIAVEWIDQLHKYHQVAIWEIKRAPDFNHRQIYTALSRMIYELERDILSTLLLGVEDDFAFEDAFSLANLALLRLIQIEDYVIKHSHTASSVYNTEDFSVMEMAERIHEILSEQSANTFPEMYRWGDD